MWKGRRLWIALGCCLALVAVPWLAYRFWWYPRTPRGAVERIEMGMTEEQVRAILKPLPSGGKGWKDLPAAVEGWTVTEGQTLHERSDDPLTVCAVYANLSMRRSVPRLGLEGPGGKFLQLGAGGPFLDKVTQDGIIFIELDEQRRVCGKTWLEFPQESVSPLERLRSWLPF
jgi:hypothetical protein